MSKLFAGTSGFAYASWKPAFYPQKLAAAKFLGYYSSRLNSVEANYSFRRLISAKVLEGWMAATPGHFTFAPKAHMRITHLRMREGHLWGQRVVTIPVDQIGRIEDDAFHLTLSKRQAEALPTMTA